MLKQNFCIQRYCFLVKLEKRYLFFSQIEHFGMDTQERVNRQEKSQEWVVGHRHSNSVILILLGTLGSLVAGLVPFAYASVFGETQSQSPMTITAGEAGVWSVFGEKDAARDVPKQ